MKKIYLLLLLVIVVISGCTSQNENEFLPTYEGNVTFKKDDLLVVFNSDGDLSIEPLEDDIKKSLKSTGLEISYKIYGKEEGPIKIGDEYTEEIVIKNTTEDTLKVNSFIIWFYEADPKSIEIEEIETGSIDSANFGLQEGFIEYSNGLEKGFDFLPGESIRIKTKQRCSEIINEEYFASNLIMFVTPPKGSAYSVEDRITLEAIE